jgi:hypothetical protein
MKAATIAWITENVLPIYPIKTFSHACLTSLLVVPQQWVQSLTARTQSHTTFPPRPASVYTMLVESDLRSGIRGVLP